MESASSDSEHDEGNEVVMPNDAASGEQLDSQARRLKEKFEAELLSHRFDSVFYSVVLAFLYN